MSNMLSVTIRFLCLEVNPRASRTIPFVSKAIGVPLAKLRRALWRGKTLKELGFTAEIEPEYFCVKAPVFPFDRSREQTPASVPR